MADGAAELSTMARVSLRVSVIVAVHNPGPHFDDLIDSFLAQTLPPDEFEVLLCDDGSDEATGARLDQVAAEHPHITVHKLEHSGWPGTPRNHGIDTAQGRYIFFCDHDDRLGPDALRRMADYADEHSCDVLVGKLVGVGRALPRRMFRRTIPDAVLGVDPLLDILTPHKLFRTEFVRANGIRFPDGRVRLEDHMFVMTAYFKASVISILADYPCYYWTQRQDRPSASATRIEPEQYFHHLRSVLDIVEENTEPGSLRDSLLTHWYRGKVLKRLGGRQMARYPADYRRTLLDVVTPLTQERFGPQLDPYLPFPMRVRSALLRAGRTDDLVTLAGIEAGLQCRADVTRIGWDAAGRLTMTVTARMSYADGTPLVFEAPTDVSGVDDGTPPSGRLRDRLSAPARIWRLPAPIAPDVLTDTVMDAGNDIARNGVEVYLRDKSDEADYRLPTEGDGLTVTVTVDPRTARAGRAVTGRSELIAQVRCAGWSFSVAARIEDDAVLVAARRASGGSLARTIGTREHTVELRGTRRVTMKARKLTAEELAERPESWAPARGVRGRAARSGQAVLAATRDRLPPGARRLAGRLRRRLRSRFPSRFPSRFR
jgi:poly(ribitol-phosphate) beta-N-acetylglucosaminyltransferase